ncbi:MAG: hypothetical protein C4295_05460 [Candidatus Fervidibacterota bacterium]
MKRQKPLLWGWVVALFVVGTATLLGAWHRYQRPTVAVFCYHEIAPNPTNSMTLEPIQFEAHLRWLKHSGFLTLTGEQLLRFLRGEWQPQEPAVVLTFDDGYEGVYNYAYPLLKRYGYCGIVFPVVAKIDMPRHLTWEQLREMVDSGVMEVGVHAYEMHCSLTRMLEKSPNPVKTLERIARDWTKAKWLLQTRLGVRVFLLAFPQGDYNEVLIALAKSLGFEGLFTADIGVNKLGEGTERIKRIGTSAPHTTVWRLRLRLLRAQWFPQSVNEQY